MQTKYKVLIIIAALIALLIFVFGFLGSPEMIAIFWVPVVQKTVKENFFLSFFLVIIISLALSFSTNLMTRKVTDVKRLKRYQVEVDKWKQQEKIAKNAENPNRKLMIKVGRKKKYIEKLQRNMATERLKPSLFTFVPYILLFVILSRFVFVYYPVAIFPFNLGKVPILNMFFLFLGNLSVPNPIVNGVIFYYYGWYSICLFTFNMIVQRILGTKLQ